MVNEEIEGNKGKLQSRENSPNTLLGMYDIAA